MFTTENPRNITNLIDYGRRHIFCRPASSWRVRRALHGGDTSKGQQIGRLITYYWKHKKYHSRKKTGRRGAESKRDLDHRLHHSYIDQIVSGILDKSIQKALLGVNDIQGYLYLQGSKPRISIDFKGRRKSPSTFRNKDILTIRYELFNSN